MIVYEPFKTLPIEGLYAELQFEFPDLPNGMFAHYATRAARKISRSTGVLRRDIRIVPIPGVHTYNLKAPDGYRVDKIYAVHAKDSCGVHDVSRRFVHPVGMSICCGDASWYDSVEDVINIYYCGCGCACEYVVHCSTIPPVDACELPEVFFTDLSELLTMAVKVSLLQISGRPWTNINMALAIENKLNKFLADRAVDVATHKMKGAVRINFGPSLSNDCGIGYVI